MNNEASLERVVSSLIYRSCLLLDEKKFEDYLALCADNFHYTITTYSPEIRAEMVWMDEDKASLKKILDVLSRHNSDHSPLSRHATVYTIDYDESKKEASVVTGLQIFKTSLDTGFAAQILKERELKFPVGVIRTLPISEFKGKQYDCGRKACIRPSLYACK